ncbi:hypothetical protein [Xenorhabdus bovienii]|uniref:hypothetical protein n=1 Tax=Xenorhabdus bovienii TaxID=40576 RepID=UPI001E3E1229|nr:hypothetical protein [Xenorhabdus bovienii]
MIYDAQDNRVRGGRFYDEIAWAKSVMLASERLSLAQRQQQLCQSAVLEQSWQNTSAARALRYEVYLLSLHGVSSRYPLCH